MTLRNTITVLLLIFALGSLAYVFLSPKEQPGIIPSPSRPAHDTTIVVESVEPDFAVYFFYNDIYCSTCEKLENYALETIKNTYADELTAGTMQWKTLDMRTPENKHYVEEFGLYSKSIVLIAFKNGQIHRFNNLEDIWDKVGDKDLYNTYIKDSLNTFINEAS